MTRICSNFKILFLDKDQKKVVQRFCKNSTEKTTVNIKIISTDNTVIQGFS